jgi:hypothetical protein
MLLLLCCRRGTTAKREGEGGVDECFTSTKSTIPTKILFISLSHCYYVCLSSLLSHIGRYSSDTVSAGRSVFLIRKYTEACRHKSRGTGFVYCTDGCFFWAGIAQSV